MLQKLGIKTHLLRNFLAVVVVVIVVIVVVVVVVVVVICDVWLKMVQFG